MSTKHDLPTLPTSRMESNSVKWRPVRIAWGVRVAVARAVPGGQYGGCPLNITAELDAHPWMIQQCLQPDKSHCCEGIMDLMKILLFSWLHTTRSFLLPNNITATVCMDAFQRRLRAEGIADKLLESCNLLPENFVSDPDSCNKITDVLSFERAVDPSAMQKYCNGSSPAPFECNWCVGSMAMALNHLQGEASSGACKQNCPLFVMMYVGGGINCYDGLGPDAAYCLLSAQNLPALAPSAGRWGRPRHRHRRSFPIALWILIPAVAIIFLLSIFICLNRRRMHRLRGLKRRQIIRRYHELLGESTGLVFFSLSEIREATGNFSASNVIGEGGFGTVYKGTLPDGTQIGVKRFKDSANRGDADFSHEVHVISNVKHRNLLPLRGYCVESDEEKSQERVLVYDFMENGSLADYLFKGNKPCLSWDERYKIAVGIARGLAYLHEDAKPAIIHRDIKAANVLLDADLNALVADFGLAKFKQEEDQTHFTTRTVGTMGYVAPEYALYGHLTDKTDVFGFGIILLELMTGRRALDSTSGILEHLLISDWVCDLMLKGRAKEVIDKNIRDSGCKDSMERVLLLALQCAHPRVVCRPSISEALLILEAIHHPLPEIITVPTTEMESKLEASCNSRGDFTWLLSPENESNTSTLDSISIHSSNIENV
eukprot:Gb_04636 [translate_table: standard]